MTNLKTDHRSFDPSYNPDKLRPALLLGATQVMIALLSSVLLTSGALGRLSAYFRPVSIFRLAPS